MKGRRGNPRRELRDRKSIAEAHKSLRNLLGCSFYRKVRKFKEGTQSKGKCHGNKIFSPEHPQVERKTCLRKYPKSQKVTGDSRATGAS